MHCGSKHGLLTLLIGGLAVLAGQSSVLTFPPLEEGFPEGPVFVTATADGFFWLGGRNGLTRFDGQSFRHFNIEGAGAGIVHDQNVQSRLFSDGAGGYWFSTYSALHRMDSTDLTFTTVRLRSDSTEVQRDYRPFHFDSTRRELWLRAGDFLWAYNVRTAAYRRLAGPTQSISYAVAANENFIVGATWTGDPEVEYYHRRTTGRSFDRQPLRLPVRVMDVGIGPGDTAIYLGTTEGLGVLKFGPDSLIYRPLTPAPEAGGVPSLWVDRRGDRLWISRYGHGIGTYEFATGRLRSERAAGGLLSGRPRFLTQDLDGNVWISHREGGVDILEDRPVAFHHDSTVAAVSSLIAGPDGEIWRVGAGGTVWMGRRPYALDRPGCPAPRRARFFRSATDWFLLSLEGIYRYEPEADRWDYAPLPASQNIHGIYCDRDGRQFLLNDRGVQDFRSGRGRVETRLSPEFLDHAGPHFAGIYPLGDAAFLLAYEGVEAWVCRLTGDRYTIERIPVNGVINGVATDADGTIYLGTDTGLHRICDGAAVALLTDYGNLKNLVVEALVADRDGDLWLGSRRGLLRYVPRTGATTYFSELDGLRSTRFARVRPLLRASGAVTMAYGGGTVTFHPDSLVVDRRVSQPYIANFWINNLPQPNPGPEGVRANYRQNTLNFELACTGLGRSRLSGVQFQLLGYDDEAAFAAPGTNVRYPKLPPGDYRLQLTATSHNGLAAGRREIPIRITPPFYQTGWFRVSAALAVVLAIWGGYALLLRRERERQRLVQAQQARIAAERDRIAGEVHDDLGGQLSSILYLSEELMLAAPATALHEDLGRINELSRQSLQNVRDIIFALDNRRSTLEALVQRLSEAGQRFFQDYQIEFAATERLTRPDFTLSSRQKRNLTLIVKEAFHNIVKHAAARRVELSFTETAGRLTVSVSDNGRGFDPTDPQFARPAGGGYGLGNMREKAAAIGATLDISSVPGTATTLTIDWSLPPLPHD